MGKISRNETSILVGLDKERNLNYTITLSADGSWYYIYDKDYNKLGKSKSPLELEKRYFDI